MKRSRIFVVLIFAASIVGCTPTPPMADASASRAVVEEALAAWRNASTVDAFREGNSIVVGEPRWEAGWKLDGYEIVEQSADGFQSRCKVQLSLKDPKGNPMREAAEYLSTTSPKRTLMRTSEGW